MPMSTTDIERNAQSGAAGKTGLLGYFAGNPVAANLLMVSSSSGESRPGSVSPCRTIRQSICEPSA